MPPRPPPSRPRWLSRLLILALPLLLAACGDLPEPFLGNPGATARRLAVPETPMLAVPPPTGTMLDAQANGDFADLLALSLQKEEIPSLARVPRKTDWRLVVSAKRLGDQIVPHYAILDPSGHELGALDGSPFPAASWIAGAPWTLGQAARDAVPKVLALMMSIRATRDRADPNSLLNRTAKLYVPAVTGAPGDGNTALTRLIRAGLAEFGPLVQLTPDGADFTVKGVVTVTPLPKGQQQVEIVWTVTRPSGVLVGKVSQLNSVAAGSLGQYWGDVATVVTQEASDGINTVVKRFIGRDEPAPTEKANPGDKTTPPPAATPAPTSPPAANKPPSAASPPAAAAGPPAPATAVKAPITPAVSSTSGKPPNPVKKPQPGKKSPHIKRTTPATTAAPGPS